MEYLIVRFPETRNVWVDDVPQGTTDALLELEAGVHKITLAPPHDFSPPALEVLLQNTAVLDPCRVEFHRLPPAAVPPTPGRRA